MDYTIPILYKKLLEAKEDGYLCDSSIVGNDFIVKFHSLILNLYRKNEQIDLNQKIFFLSNTNIEDINIFLDVLYSNIITMTSFNNETIRHLFVYFDIDINIFQILDENFHFGDQDNLFIYNNPTRKHYNEIDSPNIFDSFPEDDSNNISEVINKDEIDVLISNLPVVEPGTSKRSRNSKNDNYEEVFKLLSKNLNHGDLTKIATKTNIPRQNISRWYNKLKIDPTYFPNNQIKSKNRMLFSLEIESILSTKLEKKYINSGIIISRAHALSMIKKKINQLISDRILSNYYSNFKYSTQWFRGFLKRNDLTFRKLRAVKRPQYNQEDIDGFINQLELYKINYGLENIYNMDETSWKLNSVPDRTLAKVGSESVHGYIVGNLKTSFTAIATISASGKKLPLIIIAKGKTENCTKKFKNDFHEYYITYSETGWMNSSVMISYIKYLIQIHGSDKFVLVLDSYSVHKKVSEKFKENNFKLLFIPPGATGLLQPLDKKVFGVLKSKGKSKWINYYNSTEGKTPSYSISTKFILESWSELSEELILTSWELDDESLSNNQESEDQSFEVSTNEPPTDE